MEHSYDLSIPDSATNSREEQSKVRVLKNRVEEEGRKSRTTEQSTSTKQSRGRGEEKQNRRERRKESAPALALGRLASARRLPTRGDPICGNSTAGGTPPLGGCLELRHKNHGLDNLNANVSDDQVVVL